MSSWGESAHDPGCIVPPYTAFRCVRTWSSGRKENRTHQSRSVQATERHEHTRPGDEQGASQHLLLAPPAKPSHILVASLRISRQLHPSPLASSPLTGIVTIPSSQCPRRRRLHLIRNKIPRLERVAHPKRAHRDTIRDADRAELVARDLSLLERRLDAVSETQDVLVAAIVE